MPPSKPRDGREFVRVSVTLPSDPKLLDTSDVPRCGWLYVCGLTYAREHKTDGVLLPAAVLREAGVPKRLVADLVRVGMWHEPGHGCERCPQPPVRYVVVHDYPLHNQTLGEIEQLREAGRKGATARWGVDPNRNAKSHADRTSGSHGQVEVEEEEEQTPEPTTSSRPPTARGTRLPDSWKPSDDLIAWTREQCPTVGWHDVERFRDYWTAKTGAGATKRDWDATWRNWARREQERRGPALRSTTTERINQVDTAAAQLAASENAALATLTHLAIEGQPA